jgi:hypothetical protein
MCFGEMARRNFCSDSDGRLLFVLPGRTLARQSCAHASRAESQIEMSVYIVFVRYFYLCPNSSLHPQCVPLEGGREAIQNEFWMGARDSDDTPDLFQPIESIEYRKMTQTADLDGTSTTCAVGQFPTQESAENQATLLQERVAELVALMDRKPSWNDKDLFLATANPRFFVMAEEELSEDEMDMAKDSINWLNKPSTIHRTDKESALRLWLGQAGDLRTGEPPAALEGTGASQGQSKALCEAQSPIVVPARHSLDYRSVHWYGIDYSFTEAQASLVKVLWEAWENETPDVGTQTLFQEAKLNTDRLQDAFKSRGQFHPAWQVMIVSGKTKGTYRLKSPQRH